MSELPNEEIEGRLNAQREALAYLIAHVARMEKRGGRPPDGLLDALDLHAQFQDYQEDPGAVPAGPAFAIEAAKAQEFRTLLQEARTLFAETGQEEREGSASSL